MECFSNMRVYIKWNINIHKWNSYYNVDKVDETNFYLDYIK